MENISPTNPEPRLTREMLEAVLDPHKNRSEIVDQLLTMSEKLKQLPPDIPIDDPSCLRAFQESRWQHFDQFVDESPFLRSVVDSICDFLRPDPESIKREDLNSMPGHVGDVYMRDFDAEYSFATES